MNTQSHVLLASALFTRSGVGNRARNIAAISGGFLPDLPIFIMFAWSKIQGVPEKMVWETWYFAPPWQTIVDASHSIPIYWLIIMASVFLVKSGGKNSDYGVVIVIFSLSALTHIAGDFFLHVVDGHAHFWPLSDWRFSSPVSYWDPRYYGQYFSVFEIIAGISLCVLLFRRFEEKFVRVILGLTMISYILVPAYFMYIVKHH